MKAFNGTSSNKTPRIARLRRSVRPSERTIGTSDSASARNSSTSSACDRTVKLAFSCGTNGKHCARTQRHNRKSESGRRSGPCRLRFHKTPATPPMPVPAVSLATSSRLGTRPLKEHLCDLHTGRQHKPDKHAQEHRNASAQKLGQQRKGKESQRKVDQYVYRNVSDRSAVHLLRPGVQYDQRHCGKRTG